jgi:hypothetical protein
LTKLALAVPKAPAPATAGRLPKPMLQRKPSCSASGGKECECEECKKSTQTMQRFATGALTSITAPPIVHRVLRSPGQPLDAGTRADFEPRFGHDFSQVRIHTDSRAAESARAVNALAYTVGNDVAFDRGRYAPSSAQGRRLLAHELSHVVQQREGDSHGHGQLAVGPADDIYEKEAERAAETALLGQRVMPPATAGTTKQTAIQRQATPGSPAQPASPPAKLPAGVEDLKGRDFDKVFRLDTISVIEFREDCCHPCEDLAQWMSYLATKYREIKHPFRVRFLSVNANPFVVDPTTGDCEAELASTEAEENRALAKRLGLAGGFPHIHIYAERELVWDNEKKAGNPGIEVLEQALTDAIEEASKSGALKGAETGLHLGLGTGVLGWLATFLLAPVALTAAGIGAIVGAIIGNPRGTSALSQDRVKEVANYLGKLQKEGMQGDHSLARDAVAYWSEQDFKPAMLDIALRRRLIKEMLEGSTGDADERAITKILENSTDIEITEILDPKTSDDKHRVVLEDLVSNIHGSEFEYFMEMLRARFPLVTSRKRADIQQKLLIDEPVVLAAMKQAYNNSRIGGAIPCQFIPYENKEEYDKCVKSQNPEQEQRECGGQIAKDASGAIRCNAFCSDPKREVYELSFPKSDLTVLGSYHTHPYLPGHSERGNALFGEPTSAADIDSYRKFPDRIGPEDYVIGAFNIYVMLPDGLQLVGKTSEILSVPAIAPPKDISTSLGI